MEGDEDDEVFEGIIREMENINRKGKLAMKEVSEGFP